MKKIILASLLASTILTNEVSAKSEIIKVKEFHVTNVVTVIVTNNKVPVPRTIVQISQNDHILGSGTVNGEGVVVLSLQKHNNDAVDITASSAGYQTVKMTGVVLKEKSSLAISLEKQVEGMPLINIIPAANVLGEGVNLNEAQLVKADAEKMLSQTKTKGNNMNAATEEAAEKAKLKGAEEARDAAAKKREKAMMELEKNQAKEEKMAEAQAAANEKQKEVNNELKAKEEKAKEEAKKIKEQEKEAKEQVKAANEQAKEKAKKAKEDAKAANEKAKKAKAQTKYNGGIAKLKASQNKVTVGRSKVEKSQLKLDEKIRKGKIDATKAKVAQLKIDQKSLKLDLTQKKLEAKRKKLDKKYKDL